jgi:histidine ammonia-lyase
MIGEFYCFIFALRNRLIERNIRGISGVEFVTAALALDMRDRIEENPHKIGKGSAKAREVIRRYVEFLDIDPPLYPDHNVMKELVKSCEILDDVEQLIGPLE